MGVKFFEPPSSFLSRLADGLRMKVTQISQMTHFFSWWFRIKSVFLWHKLNVLIGNINETDSKDMLNSYKRLNVMKTVITYGTYDLLHQGHINLLKRAKELGDYLIVGVTNDNFDRDRGKLNVRNNVLERVEAVKATGYADKIIIEDYVGQKIDDIQKYDVDIFAIGSDWEGKFDYLNEYCQVVYLPRTQGISSTKLRNENQEIVNVGIIGCGRIA